MFELGKKDELIRVNELQPINIQGRPTVMPELNENENVVCGYDQGIGERMIVCENLQDMQDLYDKYAQGSTLRIHWYKAHDVGFIFIVPPGRLEED